MGVNEMRGGISMQACVYAHQYVRVCVCVSQDCQYVYVCVRVCLPLRGAWGLTLSPPGLPPQDQTPAASPPPDTYTQATRTP